jgi:YegS/Rv2252/BmrU family lipid kinase
MKRVAVIAHSKKSIGGGLPELRRRLEERDGIEVMWYEVPKSAKAGKRARAAAKEGADLVLVWGGDGSVQQCIDGLAGTGVTLAIMPAGTANLFATNLGVPSSIEEALDIAFNGRRATLDTGVVNGEHFAVMSGTGFDARMIGMVSGKTKRRLGRVAYVWTGLKAARAKPISMTVDADGSTWFSGDATCLLVANVPKVIGGMEVFPDADPENGTLEVGLVTAHGLGQWAKVLMDVVGGHAETARYVHRTRARELNVKTKGSQPYELDGGARPATKELHFSIEPDAINVMVPEGER